MKKSNIFKLFAVVLTCICLATALLIPAFATMDGVIPNEYENMEMYTPVTDIRGWLYSSFTGFIYQNTPEDNLLRVSGQAQGGYYPDFETTIYVEIDNRDFLPSSDNITFEDSGSSEIEQSRVVSAGVSMLFSDFGDHGERPQGLVEGRTDSETNPSDYWYIGKFMYYDVDAGEWQNR